VEAQRTIAIDQHRASAADGKSLDQIGYKPRQADTDEDEPDNARRFEQRQPPLAPRHDKTGNDQDDHEEHEAGIEYPVTFAIGGDLLENGDGVGRPTHRIARDQGVAPDRDREHQARIRRGTRPSAAGQCRRDSV
jgi:hypothetical protein